MGRLRALQSPVMREALLRKAALGTVAAGKRTVPRRTGNLGRSIHVGNIGAETAEIIVSAGYAAFVEFGTRPHEIRPKNRKVLAWGATAGGRRLSGSMTAAARRGSLGLGGKGGIQMVGAAGPSSGPVIFARVVHHPGTSPNPFMERALQSALEAGGLTDIIIGAWNAGG